MVVSARLSAYGNQQREMKVRGSFAVAARCSLEFVDIARARGGDRSAPFGAGTVRIDGSRVRIYDSSSLALARVRSD